MLRLSLLVFCALFINSCSCGESESSLDKNYEEASQNDPRSYDRWRPWDDYDDDRRYKNFKCPSSYGSFPDPEDCSSFYVCVRGRGTRRRCHSYELFDKYKRRCLSKYVAVCETGVTTDVPEGISTPKDDFSCPFAYGNFMHPRHCWKYYVCNIFRPTMKTCRKGELFDGVKLKCKPEKKVHCGIRDKPNVGGTTIPITEPTESTFQEITSTKEPRTVWPIKTEKPTPKLPSPTPIKTEKPTPRPPTPTPIKTERPTPRPPSPTPIKTERPTTRPPTPTPIKTERPTPRPHTPTPIKTEKPTPRPPSPTPIKTTPTSKPTGPPKVDCDEDDLDCIITGTGEQPKWFTCPEDMGSYPHPSSKRLFIFCLNWQPSVKKCGPKLVYSIHLRTCIPQ